MRALDGIMFRRCAATALLLIAAPASSVSAHSILLSRGTVVVHADRVAVEIEICAEDFIHLYNLRSNGDDFAISDLTDAIERHRLDLPNRFILRDGEGVRLIGRVVDMRGTPQESDRIGLGALRRTLVTYVLEYALGKPVTYLTFQQRFAEDHAELPAQLLLHVRNSANEHGRLIQLTNRGNVETLNVAPLACESSNAIKAVDFEDRFKSVHVLASRSNSRIEIDLYIPLVMMETFVPIRRAERDFITEEEIDAAIRDLIDTFTRRPPAVIETDAAAAPIELVMRRGAFLSPCEVTIDDAARKKGRIGTWSARVAVRFAADLDDRTDANLTWRLFNPVVLNTNLRLRAEASKPTEHLLLPGHCTIALPLPQR